MAERLNYRRSWQITKRWLISVLATILVVAISSVLAFKLLETRIARNFKTPEIGTVPEQVQSPGNYDFTYTSLNGQRHNLSELRGKVVFVNFWGTWCIRCVAEMPTIEKLYDNLRDDPTLVFLIVSRLDTPAKIRLYARYGHYDLPFYTIKDADIPHSLQFDQYPTTFIFAKDGSLAETQVGGADWSDGSVAQSIRKLEAK